MNWSISTYIALNAFLIFSWFQSIHYLWKIFISLQLCEGPSQTCMHILPYIFRVLYFIFLKTWFFYQTLFLHIKLLYNQSNDKKKSQWEIIWSACKEFQLPSLFFLFFLIGGKIGTSAFYVGTDDCLKFWGTWVVESGSIELGDVNIPGFFFVQGENSECIWIWCQAQHFV